MSRLPEIGAYAVLRGTQQFVADAFRVERALGGMNAATSALGSNAVRDFNRASTAAQAFGSALQTGITIASVALVGAGVAVKNVTADFQESLAFIESITQSSGQAISALSQNIDQLSTQGTFGLRKLGEATAELARGGLTLQDLADGAIETAQNFAIAARGEIELAEAAELVATGIQTFNLNANEANRITDSITGVAQRSTATFRDLGVAFRYAAPGAVGLNISVEELSAALGVLADSGIRGSRAGTALRQVFTTLVDPTDRAREVLDAYGLSIFDAQGKVRPLRDIFIDFEKALGPSAVATGKLTEAQRQNALATIFTQNAYSAMNAILNRGVQEYDDMRAAINEVSAAEVASRLLETTNARTKIFQANVESAANAIGQTLIPAFNDLLKVGTEIAQNFRIVGLALQTLTGQNATPLFQEFEKTGIGDTLLPIINAFATLGNTIDTLIIPPVQRLIAAFDFSEQIDSVGMLTSAFQTFAGVFGLFAQGFNLVVNGFAAIIEGANEFGTITRGVEVLMVGLNRSFQIFAVSAVAGFAQFAAIIAAPIMLIGNLTTSVVLLIGTIQQFADESLPAFVNFADNIGAVAQTAVQFIGENFRQLGLDVLTFIGDLRTGTENAFGRLIDNVGKTFGGLFDSIGTVAKGALDSIIQLFDDLGLSIRPIIEQIGEGFAWIGETTGEVFDAIGTFARGALDGIGTFANSIVELAGNVASFLAPAFETALGAIKPFIFIFAVGVIAIAGIIKAVIELVQALGRVNQAASDSSSQVGGSFESLGEIVGNIFDTIGSIVSEFVDVSFKNMRFIGEAFGASFSATGEVLSSLWTELWNNITRIIVEAGPTILRILEQIWTTSLQIFIEFAEKSTVGIRFFLVSLGNSFASAGTSLNNIWLQAWNGMIGILRTAINTMAGMINAFFSALAASPVGEFVGGLSAGFAQVPAAVGGALDAAGASINEFGQTIGTNINNARGEIEGIANTVGTSFDSIRGAVGAFNFEFPQIENGFRRAGTAADDFETSTRGVPQSLDNAGKGAGRAAKEVLSLADAFDIAANKLRQRVEFISAFGEIGAKAAAALSDAILLRTPQNADKAVDSLFEIIDAMREAGIPNFLELGNELIAAFRVAIVDGTPGAVSAALELLQQLATEVGIAGRLTVESFMESFNRATLGAAIGKEGDSIMQALNKAFVDGSKKNRDALAQAALSYLETLRKNFGPAQAAAYGEEVMSALNQSIESGSGEFLFNVLQNIATDLEQQGRFTAQTFSQAFTQAAIESAQGAGSKLMDALGAAITEGGIKNTKAAGEAAFNMIEQFNKNLSPENAQNLTARFMEQLSITVQDGSAEALATFSQFVQDLNNEARDLKAAEQIAEQFKKADESIEEILKNSAAQKHVENLRDALKVEQEILLDIFQTAQEAEAINRRRDQEDEDITRGRQRKLEDLEREHQDKLAEIRAKRGRNARPLLTLTGGFSKAGTEADEEIAKENERHKQRLENVAREVAREDEDRQRKRDREDADREFQKIQETKMREFREGQTLILDKFNEKIDNERLQERIDNIIKERDKRVGEIEGENERIKALFELRFDDITEVFVDPLTDDLDHMFDEALDDLDEFVNKLKGLEVTVSVTKKAEEESSGPPIGISSFQHGGIVPGFGRKLIWAHGGETVLPTRIPLSSAQPVAPNINRSSVVNNNLTVNANYAQTESPVQVRHDMQALIMLAGGR